MNDDALLVQPEAPDAIGIEVPVLFTASIVLINHQGQVTRMGFSLPPGLYPNPDYLVKLVKEATRESIKALKLQSNDLSWRLPTPTEFVRITSGNNTINAKKKYQEPYSVKLEVEKEDNDDNSDGR